MREAIGSSLLLYIIVFIVGIVLILLVNALSYSKAFKIKNRIINTIVESGEVDIAKIDNDIASVGYELNSGTDCSNTNYYRSNNCRSEDGIGFVGCSEKSTLEIVSSNPAYDYCIYKITLSDNKDDTPDPYYYSVVTFTHFDLPLIGDFIRQEVSGETKILGKNYDY